MSIDLGVYFGGSSMTIAYFRDDNGSIIVNEAGDRSTPSAIAINDNEFSVGLPAKQNMIRNSKNTILQAKHFICISLGQINQDLVQKVECEVKQFLIETVIKFFYNHVYLYLMINKDKRIWSERS